MLDFLEHPACWNIDLSLLNHLRKSPLQVALEILEEHPDELDASMSVVILTTMEKLQREQQLMHWRNAQRTQRIPRMDPTQQKFARIRQRSLAGLRVVHVLSQNASLDLIFRSLLRTLEEDAARSSPLLDLAFAPLESTEVRHGWNLLMLIFASLAQVEPNAAEDDDEEFKLEKEQARVIIPAILQQLLKLLPSYDVSTRDLHGRNALHALCDAVAPSSEEHWAYAMMSALISRGCNVNEPDGQGWAPLLTLVRRCCILVQCCRLSMLNDYSRRRRCGLLLLIGSVRQSSPFCLWPSFVAVQGSKSIRSLSGR
jgi:hypothetical protein